MNLAFLQASKNLGNTKRNPSVGCVIVKKGCVVSASCTGINGRPHAENLALSYRKSNLKNSNLYVTLEPCSHYGKTPPCVKKIIKNKIKKVFFSINDPDLRSFNKSKKIFNKNRIIVKKGILESSAKKFYKSYINYKEDLLPYVTAKIAVSKDWFTKHNKKKWITNSFSRGRVHLMRAQHDCIVTSSKTVIEDNPMLTCRISGLNHHSPARIILDKNLKTPINSNVIRFSNKYNTIIFFNKFNYKKFKYFRKMKIKLIKTPLSYGDDFDLKEILIKIRQLGFSRIFLESGLKLTTSFLKKNLVNDFQLFISGTKIKRNGRNSFKKNMKLLTKKKHINVKVNLLDDKLIHYCVK
tara:strand:+ start:71 stop:1129 length:1059 start_codon:yes stop_codon:yes gene_type:complete